MMINLTITVEHDATDTKVIPRENLNIECNLSHFELKKHLYIA